MKIGLFDSGLGGLIILGAIAKSLPQYDYLYYGDTKHLPYGDKSEDEIFELTKAGVEYLFEHNCLLVIVACNTASAETLRRLQDNFLPSQYPDRKILGVIIPTVETLIAEKSRQALLLATKRTVESEKYKKELLKYGGESTNVTLSSRAVPELVPLIEKNKISEALTLAQSAIDDTFTRVGEVETVILGCTHYSVLKGGLRDRYKDQVRFLAQDEIIPKKLKEYLHKHNEIEKLLSQNSTKEIFLTEPRGEYEETLSWFM